MLAKQNDGDTEACLLLFTHAITPILNI